MNRLRRSQSSLVHFPTLGSLRTFPELCTRGTLFGLPCLFAQKWQHLYKWYAYFTSLSPEHSVIYKRYLFIQPDACCKYKMIFPLPVCKKMLEYIIQNFPHLLFQNFNENHQKRASSTEEMRWHAGESTELQCPEAHLPCSLRPDALYHFA